MGRHGIAVLVYGLSGLALVGCVDPGEDALLIVLHNQVPEEGCQVSPSEAGPFIPAGRIDAIGQLGNANPVGYLMTPTIKNLGDSQGGMFEAERTVILQGARVTVTLENSGDIGVDLAGLPTQFTAPFSGAVSPDGGVAATIFEAVPAAVVARLGPALHDENPDTPNKLALLTAEFTVFGRMNDGGIEAAPFTYPVTVCYGCLYTNLGLCANVAAGMYGTGGACNLFQDAPAQCCVSSTGALVCPAVPESGT